MKHLPYLLFISLCLSCTFPTIEQVQKESNEIQRILRGSTDCEELMSVGYSIKNNVRHSATIKLVGCPFENHVDESARLLTILQDSLDYICEISDLTFVFVNKGIYKKKKYYKCQ